MTTPTVTPAPTALPLTNLTDVNDTYEAFRVNCKFSGDATTTPMIGIFQTWSDSSGTKRKAIEPAYVLFEPSQDGLNAFIAKIQAVYAAGVASPRSFKPGVVNTPFRRRIHKKVK